MFQSIAYPESLEERYNLVKQQLVGILESSIDSISDYANITALLSLAVPNINWVGFYLLKKEKLILGPFQGLPACSYLPTNKGVCWQAITNQAPLYINDVTKFPGHIACDSASASELVIPIFIDEKIIAILDIDSPLINRFSPEEIKYLVELMNIFQTNYKL